jgi:hypothetical protein
MSKKSPVIIFYGNIRNNLNEMILVFDIENKI